MEMALSIDGTLVGRAINGNYHIQVTFYVPKNPKRITYQEVNNVFV